jgi:cytidyltransferase-like protein
MAVPVSESIAFSVGITMPVAYTIGRFQPPTIGHKSLIERVKSEAGPDGKAYVFVSSTTTPKDKNPLESTDKMPILRHLVEDGVEFVDTAVCKAEGTPCGGAIAAFYYLLDHEKHKAEDIVLVVGNDHRDDFGPTAPIWNIKATDGKPVHRFGPGGEVSAGQSLPVGNFVLVASADRDKDLEKKDDVNMSGTKARQYVKLGRKDDFYLAVGANDPASKAAANTVYAKIAGSFKKKGGHDHNLRPRVAIATSDDTTDTLLLEKGNGPDAEFTYGGGRRRTYRRCRKCGLPKKPETQ